MIQYPNKTKNHRTICKQGSHIAIASVCVETLCCVVAKGLDFTHHHQWPCSTFTKCSKSVIKWMVRSTDSLHTQTGSLALCLLFHRYPYRVVPLWSQAKDLLGEI